MKRYSLDTVKMFLKVPPSLLGILVYLVFSPPGANALPNLCREDRDDLLLRVTRQFGFWNSSEYKYFNLLSPYSGDTPNYNAHFIAVETEAHEVEKFA